MGIGDELNGYGVELDLYKTIGGSPNERCTNFTDRELKLLKGYRIALYNHRTKKISSFHSFELCRDIPGASKAYPGCKIYFGDCNETLDDSILMPPRKDWRDRAYGKPPYKLSIIVEQYL